MIRKHLVLSSRTKWRKDHEDRASCHCCDYWFDDDGALRIKEVAADEDVEPGRRVVEFISDDVMTLTAENAGIVTTLKRVKE